MLSRLMTRKEQLVLLVFAGAILVGAAVIWYARANEGADSLTAAAIPAAPSLTTVEEPTKAVPALATAHPPAVQQPPDAPPLQPPAEAAPEPEAPPPPKPPAMIGVSAVGEVRNPDVYMLSEGARVKDLLAKAGGATPNADLSDINLAASLMDGTTLTIPARKLPGRRAVLAAYVNPPQYTISGWQPPQAPAPAEPATKSEAEPALPPDDPPAQQVSGLIDLNSASQDQLETLPGIGPKLAGEIIAYRARAPFASVDDLTNVSGIGDKKLESVRPFVTVR